jgi:hypothetical protein
MRAAIGYTAEVMEIVIVGSYCQAPLLVELEVG